MLGFWDILILALFVGAVVLCTWRGFVKSLSGIARLVCAFLLAKVFSPMLGAVLSEKWIGPKVYGWLENKVAEMIGGIENAANLDALFHEETSGFAALLQRFGASDQLEELEMKYGEGVAATQEKISEMVRSFAEPWVNRFSVAIAAVLIFVVSFLVLLLLIKLLAVLIDRINVLNRTNRILGCILGVVLGLCGVVAACYVCNLGIGLLTLFGASTESLTDAVDSSVLFGWVYRLVFGISV